MKRFITGVKIADFRLTPGWLFPPNLMCAVKCHVKITDDRVERALVEWKMFYLLIIASSLNNFDYRVGEGGEYSIYLWVGRCGPVPHTLTLFKTNIADFSTLFKTELRFLTPCSRHLKLRLKEVVWLSCRVINGNLMCLVSMRKSTEVNIN